MKKRADNTKQTERLKQILREKSYLRNGPYTLSSGKISDVFFDVKRTSLNPEGSILAADLILDKLEGLNVTAIGGLAIGACPIVSAICVRIEQRKMKISTFYVRKEPKPHGTQNQIEGMELKPSDRVVIVDDVATTGGSIMGAVNPVKAIGCNIVLAMVIVDRLEGAKQKLDNEGIVLDSLFTRDDLE